MDNDHVRVIEAKPPAPYIGGKKALGATLARMIERVPHKIYAEPFVGMGGVFLRRRFAPPCEVINDVSGDVTTLFRILQRHYPAFMDMLKFQLTSRRDFDRLRATDPATLTDLERAARFLYLQRLAFGGKVSGRNFGVRMPGRFDVTKLGPELAELSERLAGVVIENLSYGDFIDRYDAPEVLFYLDPPYAGSEWDYGDRVFAHGDFARIADRLARLKGAFILSINETPETRRVFAAFDIETVDVIYTINGESPKPVKELIVTTRDLRNGLKDPGLFD
ncbi:MAG TPA: DNA adenine methylase [Methylovirgula sp.]|jgi:DNA adenine methylase